MNLNLILNALLLKQVMWNEQDFRSCLRLKQAAPPVRVGIVGHAIQLVGNHTYYRAIRE